MNPNDPRPNNPNNPNDRDDIAAVPVAASPVKRYGWLLLLLPLLLLGLFLSRCGRDDANRAADATRRTADDAANATRETAGRAADKTKDAANRTADAAGNAAAKVGDAARNTADAARDATARVADATRNAAANTADATRQAGAALVNPFTLNTTGPDVNKAVLNFDANSTAPNTNATGVLNNVAAYLKANPSARVTLRGYTDNSGPADVNRQLTERRIASVKSALSSMGVDTGRMSAANYAEAYPVTDNSTPQAREMNRRVEIELAR